MAENNIAQGGVLHPPSIGWENSAVECCVFLVDCLQEKVVDDGLLLRGRACLQK